MEVVIFGSGHIALHLAQTLSKEGGNVTIIAQEKDKLEQIAQASDVAVIQGKGTDWQLLEEVLDSDPELFIALTRHDETNLVACHIAKSLGYRKTIARVRENFYLDSVRLNFSRLFQVDHLISPEWLIAQDIVSNVFNLASIASESFAQGSIMMRTIVVPEKWPGIRKALHALSLPENLMLSLINRASAKGKGTVIFPHGNDYLEAGDEAVFIGQADKVANLHEWFNLSQKQVNSAVILGGSLVCKHVAQKLVRHGVSVKIIEKDYQKCLELSEELPHASIVHHDGLDRQFLEGEKVNLCDVFIAATREDQVNILGGMIAKEVGCEKVLVSLSDSQLRPLLKKQGISGFVSPRLKAENRILSIAHEKSITSSVSLYDNQAEIFEIKASPSSPVIGIPLKDLGPLLPQDVLLVGIQNKGKVLIANGNSIIGPGDTVIVISAPKHQKAMYKIF